MLLLLQDLLVAHLGISHTCGSSVHVVLHSTGAHPIWGGRHLLVLAREKKLLLDVLHVLQNGIHLSRVLRGLMRRWIRKHPPRPLVRTSWRNELLLLVLQSEEVRQRRREQLLLDVLVPLGLWGIRRPIYCHMFIQVLKSAPHVSLISLSMDNVMWKGSSK